MKKLFSLFAAVLMAGSMMADDDATLIKFLEAQVATEVAGSTYGSEGFTLVIPESSDKATIDANNCTFGFSAEETVSFTYRLKTGGASSKDGRKFTLNIPEEGPLAIYARTSKAADTNRNFVIANGTDTIVNHICLDTDTVEGASSKIFLPVIVENVPAGSYTITYPVDGINFYGFQMVVEETEKTHVSELLYEMTTDEKQGSNNSYAGNCDIEMGGIVWNFTGNSQMNPWRVGGKSMDKVDREVYTKTAYPVALDSVCLHLGNNTMTSLDGVKLVYSTNADFSESKEVIATVPEAFPATVTFAVEGGFPAKAYYKFVFTCTESGSKNQYIQFNGVDFWGVKPDAPTVEAPVFTEAAGEYYDPQTIHLTCATEGAVMYYTTDGNEPTVESSLYYPLQGIYLPAGTTATIKAIAYNNDSDNPQFSEVVEKTYTIATEYASLTELINKAGAPAGQKVVVTLTNETIDSLYVSSSQKTNGIYLTAAGRMVEIYCYNVPATWAVGGTVSGVVKGEWKEYLGTWEVCPTSWEGITYKAALPDGPAIEIDVDAKTFSITPANETDIYMFTLLNPSYPSVVVSKEFAEMMAETLASEFGADWTLEDNVEEGLAYQGAIETTSLEAIGELEEYVTYAMVAFVLVENDATLHTAEVASKVTYVEFTLSPATGLQNATAVKAVKTVENGHVVIIREGVRYNAVGVKF